MTFPEWKTLAAKILQMSSEEFNRKFNKIMDKNMKELNPRLTAYQYYAFNPQTSTVSYKFTEASNKITTYRSYSLRTLLQDVKQLRSEFVLPGMEHFKEFYNKIISEFPKYTLNGVLDDVSSIIKRKLELSVTEEYEICAFTPNFMIINIFNSKGQHIQTDNVFFEDLEQAILYKEEGLNNINTEQTEFMHI